ncbi:MAG: efflux RND transporter periplasmic adaptor subunit [Gammaproteobacteria bacterium]|nr:efflux RND transporter periplasmic adaptor subunit [Gammaproteobacteria bacterium]
MKRIFRLCTILSGLLVVQQVGAVDLDATVDWSRRGELGTMVSGVIKEVLVHAGEQVAKGAPLLRLDDRGYQARLQEAKALQGQYRLQFEEAQREEERTAELYERTVLSDHDRQMGLITLAVAKAAYRSATAALVQAQLDLEWSVLRAPFSGVVVELAANPGQAVVSNLQSDSLIVLVDNQRMVARTKVGLKLLEEIASSTQVTVSVRGQRLSGELRSIGMEPVGRSEKEPLYQLVVLFTPPADLRVRSGEPATVQLSGL